MVQIVRITYHDDASASKDVEVMVCSSIQTAKEILLGEVNKDFDGEWKSIKEAKSALHEELEHCNCSEDETHFAWMDNGKGTEYHIARIDTRKVNTCYQQCFSVG